MFNSMSFEERVELVKELNDKVLDYGDEDLYDSWFTYGVPDCPSEDDFRWFAENEEEFYDLIGLYKDLEKEMR